MKLLIISNNLERAGFRQRITVHLDFLKANGVDCEVAKLPSGLLVRLKFFRQTAAFDGVLLHKKGLNVLDARWLRRCAKKIIYHFDDAIMYRDKDPGRYSAAHFRPWKRSVELADMVIAGSSYLADHARRFNANVKIVPTAIEIADYKFHDYAQKGDKLRLVWIGSKSTLSYLAEITPVLEKIGATFNNIVLRIIGDDFFELKNMPVEKVLWEKHSRGARLAECDIGLAPLPDDPFTQGKCSFKVLEYSASGLPAVASPVGTNVDNIRDGQTGFLVNSPEEWFEKLNVLIQDSQRRRQMGLKGIEVARSHDMAVVGRQMVELICDCLGRKVKNV